MRFENLTVEEFAQKITEHRAARLADHLLRQLGKRPIPPEGRLVASSFGPDFAYGTRTPESSQDGGEPIAVYWLDFPDVDA